MANRRSGGGGLAATGSFETFGLDAVDGPEDGAKAIRVWTIGSWDVTIT